MNNTQIKFVHWRLGVLHHFQNYFSYRTTFVAEIGVLREIHRPVASHWQTLSHNIVSSTPHHEWGSSPQFKSCKDLYSRNDTNLVFSRFILRGEVACYNSWAKNNSFILKWLENSQENQPITPKFVLYIVCILHYTKHSLDLAI